MHGDTVQLAAFGLAAFALVAALVPFASSIAGAYGVRRLPEVVRRPNLQPVLAVAAVVGVALFVAGVRVDLVDSPTDLVLTVVWLIAVAGAMTVLDANIGGTAGVVATAGAVGLTTIAALRHQTLVGDLTAILAGAAGAVVLYNWHPARARLATVGPPALGMALAALTLKTHFAHQSRGAFAVALVAATPMCFAALVALDRWSRGAPLYMAPASRRRRPGDYVLDPTLVAATVGAAAAALAATGIAVDRGTVAVWAALPVGGVSAILVLECLDLFGRRADARESAFVARQRRRPEAIAGFSQGAIPPEEFLSREWARPPEHSQAAAFNRIVGTAENWAAAIKPDTTLAAVDPQTPEGESENLNFRWGKLGASGDPLPPLAEEAAAAPEPAPTPPPPPESAARYEQRPVDPYLPQRESAQMYDLQADVRDLVRMSRTMLDTLAAQLKQNEESARLVTGHLGSTENQLANLADRMRSLGETVAQPQPIALDAERLAHSVRRVEARLQTLVEDVQRQTTGQGGDVARVVEQTAAIRDRQSDLTSVIGELTSAQQAIQANVAALRNEQLAAARSIESDLGSVAEQTSALRQAQAELTAALSEQAAALRSVQADLGQSGVGGSAAIERQMATLTETIRQAVAEELRRESADGSGIGAAVSEQASTLRMLQGDLTSILSEQAAAIRSIQASATGDVSRADFDRLRNDLFANQERQFANIVGVIRTLLHESDELVLAMGRVPKADRAGRAFDMLRLSGGSDWEERESQP